MVPIQRAKIVRVLAHCPVCKSVVEFEQTLDAVLEAVQRPQPKSLYDIPMPSGIELHREPETEPAVPNASPPSPGERLRIVRWWFGLEGLLTLPVAIGVNYFTLSSSNLKRVGNDGLLFFWIGWFAPFVLGLWLAHYALAGLLNRTVIILERGSLSIRHGPIPVRGNCDVLLRDVLQLYTIERQIAHRSRSQGCVYDLRADLRGGGTITIARGLNSPNQAQFIERAIELYAGIEDHPMPNEAPK